MSKTVIVPGATAGVNTIVTDEEREGCRNDRRNDCGGKLDEIILREALANQRVRERDNVESREAIACVKANALSIEGRALVEAAKNAAADILAIEKTSAALGVQAEKLAAAGALQASTIASASVLEAAKNAAAIEIQAEKLGAANVLQQQVLASAAALTAANNAAATAALINSTTCDIKSQMAECCCDIKSQMAECCCDIKTSVRDDGDKTRDRMNHINDLALAVQLSDSKNEVSELRTQLLIEQKMAHCGGHGHHGS